MNPRRGRFVGMNATASGCLVRPVEEPLYGQGENCFGKAEVVGVGKLRVSFLGKQQQKLPPHTKTSPSRPFGPLMTVSPFDIPKKLHMFPAKMQLFGNPLPY